jgi:hypothetical protein
MRKTLLTSAPPEVEEELSEELRAMILAYQLLEDRMLAAYAQGEFTFEKFCRQSDKTLSALPIAEGLRRKILGSVIHRALKVTPKSRSRGNHGKPKWEREAAAEAVQIFAKRGLARDLREGEAYDATVKHMRAFGIFMTPRQVEKWDRESRKSSARKSKTRR